MNPVEMNTEQLIAMYAYVEREARQLRGKPTEYTVLTGLCPVNTIEMQAKRIQDLLLKIQELERAK